LYALEDERMLVRMDAFVFFIQSTSVYQNGNMDSMIVLVNQYNMH